MEWTGLMRSYRLDNKPKQKYGLFNKLSLALIGSCDVANKLHKFLTREKQHRQEINRHFDITLNHYDPMIFAENIEPN